MHYHITFLHSFFLSLSLSLSLLLYSRAFLLSLLNWVRLRLRLALRPAPQHNTGNPPGGGGVRHPSLNSRSSVVVLTILQVRDGSCYGVINIAGNFYEARRRCRWRRRRRRRPLWNSDDMLENPFRANFITRLAKFSWSHCNPFT